MKTCTILTLSTLVYFQTAYTQTTANATLSFQIEGLKPSIVTLGYYFGGQAYRVDSVKIDGAAGKFTFQ